MWHHQFLKGGPALVSLPSSAHEHDLVRAIRSRYLRDEERYDAWGAQGKVLAIHETLTAEGYDIREMTDDGVEFQRLANIVFPRAFEVRRLRHVPPSIRNAIVIYYHDLRQALHVQNLGQTYALSLALRETALRFGLPLTETEEILASR